MSSIQYHKTEPETTKSSYTEYDSIDFVLAYPGRKVMLNSFRLVGNLEIQKAGVAMGAIDVRIDPNTGVHSFFDSFTVSCDKYGQLSSFSNYPRYVKSFRNATMSASDVGFSLQTVSELCAGDPATLSDMLQGPPPNTATAGNSLSTEPIDFSFKPMISINKAKGQTQISYKDWGNIRLSLNLARNNGCLFGSVMAADVAYSITNLRCIFTSVLDDGVVNKMPTILEPIISNKQTISSNFANTSHRVPATVTSFSSTFQLLSRENTLVNNNLATSELPGLTQLQFLFQDSTNANITYTIKERSEVISRYLESFKRTDHGDNQAKLMNLRSNEGYGIGLYFNEAIDLKNQKFNAQFTTSVDSTNPYIMYSFCSIVLEL